MKPFGWIAIGLLTGTALCYFILSRKPPVIYQPVNNDSINKVVSKIMESEKVYRDSVKTLNQNIKVLEYQKNLLHEKYKNYTVNDAVLWLDSFERANGIH